MTSNPTRTANGEATQRLHRLAELGIIHSAETNHHGWWAVPSKGDTPRCFYRADEVMAFVEEVEAAHPGI